MGLATEPREQCATSGALAVGSAPRTTAPARTSSSSTRSPNIWLRGNVVMHLVDEVRARRRRQQPRLPESPDPEWKRTAVWKQASPQVALHETARVGVFQSQRAQMPATPTRGVRAATALLLSSLPGIRAARRSVGFRSVPRQGASRVNHVRGEQGPVLSIDT